jgi:L-galactose dehydrogenase
MEYRKLGKTGLDISIVGYGASPLGNVFDKTDDETEGIRAVHYAIDHGINYFDVAPMYGVTLAESRLGNAIKGKRDKIFLATKCCRYDEDVFDFSAKKVKTSIDDSLKRLQTDYVDVYQIHDVEFGDKEQVLHETIPAAIKVIESGKARFLGITGLPVAYLEHIAEHADIDTLLTWAHYNLVEDEMEKYLTPICKKKGIGLINSSPLLQRLLTERPIPAWHRSPSSLRNKIPEVVELCKNYGWDIADVAMRFCLDHPTVATTIVGMSKQRNVEANIKVLNMESNPELLEKIEELVTPVKNLMWFEGREENNLGNVPPPERSHKTAGE